MANEVEIVITGRNKAKPAVQDAKKDADGLAKKYEETSKRSTSALSHIRDALRFGLHDAIADVHGETNRISRGFRAAQESATASFDKIKADARAKLRNLFQAEDGKSIGRKIAGGIGGGMLAALKGVLSTPVVGTVVVAALAAGLAGGGMTLGAILSGGIVAGFGAGLVGLGAAALLHVEEIDDEWSQAEQKRAARFNKSAEKLRVGWRDLNRDIISGIRRAAQPLLPVLDAVQSTLRRVGREFEPVLAQGFKIAKGPLKRFIKDLGDAFLQLKPAVAPVMASFGELLDTLGPSLPGLFESMAESIIELAGIVSENRDLISSLFLGLLMSIPFVINLVGDMAAAFRGSLVFVMGLMDGLLGIMQGVMEAIAKIPGPWQESAAAMAASLAVTRGELGALRSDVESFPEQVRLEGEISDLEGKIATAKAKLKDPKLTRPERAKIRAEISDLQAKVAQARAALASLQNRTVFVDTIYRRSGIGVGTVLAPGHAHGGVIGGLGGIRRFAQGGVSGSGSSLAMVGEQGPELVRLPVGSSITGAGQTRAMQQSGFGSISMAFRSAGQQGGSALGGLGDSLREVLSFREALDKLTSSIFGQERALSSYEAAWDSAKKSLKDNKKTLNISTSAGRENRGALLALAEAAQEVVVAMREQGRSSTTVIAKMREQRAEFIKMARSMGLSKSKASALADRYGLTTTAVKTALSGKASGGVAGGMTLVGERGPELVRLPFGSQVTSANQTAAALAAGGGSGTLTVVLEVRGGQSEFDRFMAAWIRRFVRVKGGGSVQTAFGRG
ncbi:hypothetical protein [Nonomuraea sp. NPDC050643]|uniref:hypothetical protein n=1 Tax=Nonomuraea sp. NPDC050643 TaxID=3155660 RepID=UPI0033CFE766